MVKNKASMDHFQFQTQLEGEDFSNGNKFNLLPLTIFYNGKMKVYNAISQEKAEVVMLIASAAAKATRSASRAAVEQLDRKVNPRNILQDDTNDELPMARAHSLQRFLEKRRERMMEKAPCNYYSANSLYVEGPSHAQGMPPPFA